MGAIGCPCGHSRKRPTTRREIALLSKLRGHPILLCPLCHHEIETPQTVRQLRKISAFGLHLAHAACVRHKGLTPCGRGNGNGGDPLRRLSAHQEQQIASLQCAIAPGATCRQAPDAKEGG